MKREKHQILLIITHGLYNCGDRMVWAYNMLLRKLGEIINDKSKSHLSTQGSKKCQMIDSSRIDNTLF